VANTLVTRSITDDGWVITWGNGCSPCSFFADRGGTWLLNRDGTLGQQMQGTLDVRIPRTPAAIRKFLMTRNAYEGEHIEVRS
jgi:hypothetical protein